MMSGVSELTRWTRRVERVSREIGECRELGESHVRGCRGGGRRSREERELERRACGEGAV